MECLQAQSLIAKVVAMKEGTKVWSRFMGGLRLQKWVPSKSQFQLSTYFNEITYMALEGVISLHTMQPKDMHNSLHVVWLAHYQKWWPLFTEAWLSALQLRESLIGLLVWTCPTYCLPSRPKSLWSPPSNNLSWGGNDQLQNRHCHLP